MRKVLFLDRDGVLIEERGEYNYLPEHVKFVEGIVEALKKATLAGFELVVITNQGGIAKELYTHSDVEIIHRIIRKYFKDFGVDFIDWFYCPHHEVSGRCLCRKPGSLMLEKAIASYEIDPEASFFIGDKVSDWEAGKKAGVTPIQISPNENLKSRIDGIIA